MGIFAPALTNSIRGGFDKSVRRKPLARAPRAHELWVLNGGLVTEPAIMGGSFPDRAIEERVWAMGRADGGPVVWVGKLPFCRVQAHVDCACRSTRRKHRAGPAATNYQRRRPAVVLRAGSVWLSIVRSPASLHRSADIAAGRAHAESLRLRWLERWRPAEHGREGATPVGAGWPTTRSSESAEDLLARHAARSGARTLRG